MKKMIALGMLLILALMAMIPVASADSGTYYVYTENGKSLNVRSSPILRETTKVGSLKFGAKVQVLYTEGNWACIAYHWDYQLDNGEFISGDESWVMKKFLTRTNPGSKPSSSSSSSTSKPAAKEGALGVMNREFKSLQMVEPFTVFSKPVRASGFVNLRWAPHEEAEVCNIAYSGHALTVIASTTNWYQVEDTQTGKICFVMKKFTTIQ